MPEVEARSTIATILASLVGWARQIRGKLTVYLLLIGGFWTALIVSIKGVEPFLPPPAGGKDGLYYAKAFGIGLGFPTVILLMAEGLPALWRWRRDRRLIDWGAQGEVARGYFRLTPYEKRDQDDFRRADGVQDEILAWLRDDERPKILYLSGRSGAGKSSLLQASVLPGLETGDAENPQWLTLPLRGFGDPVGDLARALVKPGFLWPNPPRDLPAEILPLLRKVDARLEREDRRLLVLIDQFEEFLIFHDREPEQQRPLRQLLDDLHREPPKRIRLLLALRSDHEGDISRLNLPRLHQDGNWKQVDAFSEGQAREFLREGFTGPGLGTELIDQVVRHASELDEVRGKVRPVVLNMIGLALANRTGRPGQVIGSRECQKLMLDHVKEGLKDPLARDHAADVLKKMVTLEGRKEPPASVADLARRTGLAESVIQGCLVRLNTLGFVRPFDSDRQRSAGTQVWEISHDFVARLLSLILPNWKPALWTRLRQALLGPILVLLGIAAVFGVTQIQKSQEDRRLESIDRLQKWVRQHNGSMRLLNNGTYAISIELLGGNPLDFREVVRDGPSSLAHLISDLFLRNNRLTVLPPELGKLTSLTDLDLGYNELKALPPEAGKLASLTRLNLTSNALKILPPEIGELTSLIKLDLSFNDLRVLSPEVVNLTSLTDLNLMGIGLADLPPEVVKLTGLTSLDLSNNQLTVLPPELGKLTGLTSLDLSSNQLTALPPELGKLTGLTSLDLRGNPLTDPPPEVVEQGTQAILKYLRSKLPSPSESSTSTQPDEK